MKNYAEAKKILQELTYIEMTKEQEEIVTEYETAVFSKKIDRLIKNHSIAQIEEIIHEWWLDYEISDDTETALYSYLTSKEKAQ